MSEDKTPKPAPPMHWPSMQDEADEARDVLTGWVEELVYRFDIPAKTIPGCWNRHNPVVEALQALRDYERGCFDPAAAPTEAVAFLRAMKDVLEMCTEWVRDRGCGAVHCVDLTPRTWVTDPAGWDDGDRGPATWHVVSA